MQQLLSSLNLEAANLLVTSSPSPFGFFSKTWLLKTRFPPRLAGYFSASSVHENHHIISSIFILYTGMCKWQPKGQIKPTHLTASSGKEQYSSHVAIGLATPHAMRLFMGSECHRQKAVQEGLALHFQISYVPPSASERQSCRNIHGSSPHAHLHCQKCLYVLQARLHPNPGGRMSSLWP